MKRVPSSRSGTKIAAVIRGIARRPPPRPHVPAEQPTNFSAAPGTVYTIPPSQAAARARIAADIAAFEARGGRIERLGVTRFFHAIGDDGE